MVDPNVALQEKAQQIQLLKGKAQTLQMQLVKLTDSRENLAETKDALERLKDLKKGGELLVPIGSGVYMFATIEDTSKVMVNIGGVIGNKDLKASLAFIDKQLANLGKAQESLEGTFTELTDQLQELQLAVQLGQFGGMGPPE